MKKVIFHLGTPKTGTSIIQSHLAQNRARLRSNGFFYPVTISSDRQLYRTFESHHLLAYSVAGWEPFSRYRPEDFLRRTLKTCREYNLHTLLLSAENTYWLPRQIVGKEKPDETSFWEEKRNYMERFRNLFSNCDMQIIIYLRRQDRWLESWYNQQVKNGHVLPHNVYEFAEHCEYLMNYRRYIEVLSEVFGRNNIIVRVYEKEQLPEGLFDDFSKHSGIGDPKNFPLHHPARSNSQLLPEALEFMHICNNLEADPQTKRELRLLIRKVTKQFENEIVFQRQDLLTPNDRHKLLDQYDTDNRWIAQEYLGRNDGALFMEGFTDELAEKRTAETLTSEQVVKIIMQIFLQTIADRATGKHSTNSLLCEILSSLHKSVSSSLGPLERTWRKKADDRLWERYLWSYEKI